ncbi:leucine-rich repeat-containing protein 26 [Colossoma macropomum]|uniref:leucine-rich repeat-containing protein 26 n=1 Tax=Colossoma macropomum TaxID=42526 RepID=UPI0018655037|nr:leucine-rich repeat-containing protein 26 [Colossoma macropomum]XP_036412285.1 leucine-rich repeat-containing protein 26 [Colossoma macropomum]
MRENRTQHKRVFSLCGVLFILYLASGSEGQSQRCECLAAMVLPQLPSNLPNETCCLNFSGSSLNNLSWTAFGSLAKLEILDLSFCNLTHVDETAVGFKLSSLRELYLGHNQLRSVPRTFLANAYSLEVLDLRDNLMEDLPVDFLQSSNLLRVLLLDGNRLQFLPSTIFKPSLQQLDLEGNPWNCTCSLAEELQKVRNGNSTSLEDIVGNLTCASPPRLAGKTVWSVQAKDICPPGRTSLSALFILLPLFLLLVLLLCWCCGKTGKKKETQTSRSCKKDTHLNRNGRWAQEKPAFEEKAGAGESAKDAMLKNQLMLRPSSALLGSTRDIYEEVEVKLGSVDSLGPPPSTSSAEGTVDKVENEEKEEEDSKQDLETVSVTEVMKDSADREKAYMTQSTKYYSLVPGLEIEDSDHGEYESVDLS